MISYLETIQKVGRLENAVGWYHSHPGYGCWLSGIDVTTQRLNQQGQDPFLSVVIDPTRTCTAGKVRRILRLDSKAGPFSLSSHTWACCHMPTWVCISSLMRLS